jgi:hypothetical protein
MSYLRARARLVAVAALALVIVVVAGVAGCGSSDAQTMPTFSATAAPGPKAHEATVHITSSGSGTASAAVLLTYPNGRRDRVENATWRAMDSGTYTQSNLRAGVYAFAVYAIPANSQDARPISEGDFTAQHKVAEAKVTLP